MRDKNRIKPFLEKLGKIWEEECPDWRFGQLISNVLDFAPFKGFYMEEDEMIEYFEKHFKRRE